MTRELKISFDALTLTLVLKGTDTARRIWQATPFDGSVNTWGEEVYFATSVDAALEQDARDVVKLGEVAYWPPGRAIAIGYGRTPVSRGDEIRLASPVNVFATCDDDLRALRSIKSGSKVTVAKSG